MEMIHRLLMFILHELESFIEGQVYHSKSHVLYNREKKNMRFTLH